MAGEHGASGAWPTRQELITLMQEQTLEEIQNLVQDGGVPGLCRRLGCHPDNGLPEDVPDRDARVEAFGENRFEEKKLTPYWQYVCEQLKEKIIILLLFLATLELTVKGSIKTGEERSEAFGEASVLYITVCIIVNVAAFLDWKRERMFEQMQKRLAMSNMRFVVRGGVQLEVADGDICVGDIVSFNAHMASIISCDGLLLSGDEVKCDESALTGEPEPIEKTAIHPFMISGTTVSAGKGTFLVIAVGEHSIAGKIKKDVYGDNDIASPLYAKLHTMADTIGYVGLFAAFVAWIAMIAWTYGGRQEKDPFHFLDISMVALGILACAIPEGLPLALVIALAITSNKMSCENNLVKTLSSCETMGSATTICTDKTGTLTTNRMTVRAAYVDGKLLDPHETDPVGPRIKEDATIGDPCKELFASLVCVCTMDESGFFYKESIPQFQGNPTECALLKMAEELGYDYKDVRSSTVGRSKETLADGFANNFTSARKMMSWCVAKPDGGYRVYIKGASEIVLQRVTQIYKNGEVVTLDADQNQSLMDDVINRFAGMAMRTIGLAYKDYPGGSSTDFVNTDSQVSKPQQKKPKQVKRRTTKLSVRAKDDAIAKHGNGSVSMHKDLKDIDVVIVPESPKWASTPPVVAALSTKEVATTASMQVASADRTASDSHPVGPGKPQNILDPAVANTDGSPAFACETDLVLVGIVGIEDPLRPEVAPAIQRCFRAGIDVRMVTGDNIHTAIAIAKRAGILNLSLHCSKDGEVLPKRALEGKVFRKLVHDMDSEGLPIFNQASFDDVWPFLRVLARSSPEDKLTLAKGLNSSLVFKDTARCQMLLESEHIQIFPDRQVVAMTGDGTNDAPALKHADVGFAMGIAGTQIAKDAADIILLDDNFASIVVAAKWGRNVFDSIQKFLQFQLTVNFAILVLNVYCALVAIPVPLSVLHLLWLNLIMDSAASIALASEPPTDVLLERPPVNRNEFIISNQMMMNIIGMGTYEVVLTISLIYHYQWIPDLLPDDHSKLTGRYSRHYTMLFNIFVLLQVFNEYNSRFLRGEWQIWRGLDKNPLYMIISLGTVLLQVLMVQVAAPVLSPALKIHEKGLSGVQWAICLGFGASTLVVQQILNIARMLIMKYVLAGRPPPTMPWARPVTVGRSTDPAPEKTPERTPEKGL